MGDTTRDLKVRFLGETEGLEGAVKDAVSGLGRFGKSVDAMARRGGIAGSVLQGVGQSFGQMLNPLALATKGFDALAGVVGDAVGYAQSAAAAWREEQADLAQFHQTLDSNVAGWQRYTAELEAAIDAGMGLAFADDEQRASLSRLITATGDVTEATRLNRLAMDIARQRGIKLAVAAEAVTKAAQGQGRALRALGYRITDTKDRTLTLAEAQRQAEGSALTFARTATGELMVRLIRLDDKIENTGKYFQGTGDVMADTMLTGMEVTADAVTVFGAILEKWGIVTVKETEETAQAVSHSAFVAGRAIRRLPPMIADAVVDMKETIAGGKGGIIAQFRDLAWQSKHPFAAVNYGDWLAAKHREAMRKSKAAADAGKSAVAAQYAALAEEILTEWRAVPGAMGAITRRALQNLQPLFSRIQNITPLLAGQWTQIGAGIDDNGPFGIYEQNPEWGPAKKKKPKKPHGNRRPRRRALGGPVRSGWPYIVGEHRPELFVPGQDGYIQPSVDIRPGRREAQTVNINVTVHAGPGANGAAIGQELARYLEQYGRNGGRAHLKRVVNG